MRSLRKALTDYLSLRRSVGYRLEKPGAWLLDFVSFCERHGGDYITIDLALKWATQSERATTYTWSKRLGMVRCFARYLVADDPRTQIPLPDLLPGRQAHHTPYVYSAAEIKALISACSCFDESLVRHTYATLIGLLATTGMRLGEAIGLDRSDIDDRECIITIRNGKFGKSREVPIHSTTLVALHAYARRRDRVVRCPKSQNFFLSQAGTRLWPQNVWTAFDGIRSSAGLERRSPKPRIHDLRHTFAVRTLLRWYREGVDVECRLARLSTYMGHVNPSSTYWYLTGTPELMALAAQRLEQSLGDLQ